MNMVSHMNGEPKRPVRVFCDGCFDLVHYGHANSLRQAKAMGDLLVVGVHSDKEISESKGPPVYTEQERYRIIRAIKWTDEVAEGSTYYPNVSTLEKNNCDFATHGDDICITLDGVDPYKDLRDAGRLRIFKRTKGVSTTDIVGRMLLLTKEHHERTDSFSSNVINNHNTDKVGKTEAKLTKVGRFLQTSNKIGQFSEGIDPEPNDRIVYVSGSWDLLHAGYVDFLEAARREGDYLIVGIHSDQDVNFRKGGNFPIMNLHERTLSILALRAVSEVVIGAPYAVTSNLMDQMKIDVVVHGWTPLTPSVDGSDPMKVPKERGKFKQIDTGNRVTTNTIVQRIIQNRLDYEMRNLNKEEANVEGDKWAEMYDRLGKT